VRRIWLKSLLICLGSFCLLWGLGAGALWDPHEVTVAELSRRIALNLLGGAGLAVPDADNSVPIRADLGRGELPFTSAALGFRLFGLSDWAGRLPLTLWALLGALVLYVGVCRLWDRRAALYALLALVTMPLYFLQARSLLGEAVTLASFAIAWTGLAVAALAREQSTRARLGFAALGALGLYAGFWCRGPIVSVAVPALAVGTSALLFRPVSGRLARGLAWGMTLLGSVVLVAGLVALEQQRSSGDYSVWVGSAVAAPAQLPHFAVPFAAFMHACFPWSALAPLGLLLPWQGAEPGAQAPGAAVSGAAVLGLGASLAAAAWLAPTLGVYASPGAVCLPVLLAGGLRELERGSRRAALLGFVLAALALVVGLDLRVYPDKALVALGIDGAALPEALGTWSERLWTFSSAALAFAALLCLYEDQEQPESSRRFDRAEYDRVLKSLQELWNGNLVFALLLVEAALVGFLLLSAISERLVTLPQLEGFGSFWRTAVAVSAVAVPLLALLPLVTMLLRDIGRALFHGSWLGPRQTLLRPTRAQGLLAVGVAIGAVASLGFYPAFSRQVAPKQVFERYRELRQPGEPLALLGQQSQAARYQGGESTVHLADGAQALAFLSEGGSSGKRRFLLLRKADLGPLNAAFRERHLGNLPILDGRSSEVLLASNRRFPRREHDESPLGQLVLDAAPPPQHRVRAVLGQRQLEVLGYSVASPAGQLETSLQPATRYRFIIYFRVLARISGDWQVFVHLDGLQRRFNADHEPAEGKYPLELWREGDVIADATDVVLEPSFSPGAYRVYFGLFSGERRIEVTEGPEDDDRIAAGTLQIR
jgi:hypothetical protein